MKQRIGTKNKREQLQQLNGGDLQFSVVVNHFCKRPVEQNSKKKQRNNGF